MVESVIRRGVTLAAEPRVSGPLTSVKEKPFGAAQLCRSCAFEACAAGLHTKEEVGKLDGEITRITARRLPHVLRRPAFSDTSVNIDASDQ